MGGKKQNQAILALEQKLRENPQSRAFSRLADSYRRAGSLQTAVDLCLEGLVEHPDYVTGRLVLGRCYAQQKKYDAAVGELTRVCAEDRRNHAAMKMLADIFVRQGRAETAGRIYAILRDMEPDNYRVRQLAAKYRSNIKGTILEVLGINTNTESVTQNLMASGVNPFDMGVETIGSQTLAGGGGWTQTGTAPAAREPSGADIEDQLNSMFAEQGQQADPFGIDPGAVTQVIEPAASSGGVSGSDVADQLDMIFGQPEAPSAGAAPAAGFDMGAAEPPGSSEGGLTGSDVADQLDMIFGQPEAPSAGAAPAAGFDMGAAEPPGISEGGLTGSDVAGQLDMIFGQPEAPSAGAAPAAGFDMGAAEPPGISEGGLTGSDVADQLDMIFGQHGAPPVDADVLAGIDMDVITSAVSDEPSGGDVADQLDIMFGQQSAPSMDADALAGVDMGIAPTADEPSGSDVADQLDIMFGQQQAPSMDVDAMMGMDTGIITMAADEPSGSDVVDQLDIMFGDQNLSAPVTAEPEGGGEPEGSDIEDRLDALFGNIAAPRAGAGFPPPADNLFAEAQGGEALSGAAAAEEYFRSELLSEPDPDEAAATQAVAGELPAGLFDFDGAETMSIDKSDMLAAMSAVDAATDGEGLAGIADTIAVEHNLTETITFKPNVPEEGTEIVHGEDIEERLSELFSGSEKTGSALLTESGEDTIEDIFDTASGVLSAQELAGIEDTRGDILDEEQPEQDSGAASLDTISRESDIVSELSSTDADTDIDAILASVDAEVNATMSGIDTNALSSESDIVSELPSTDADTDIDAILAGVDAEVDAAMPGIDTNALSNESDIVSELSSDGLSITDADTDIDAILASVDAEVDATMSGIDTNALSNESDIVSELSSDVLSITDADTDIDAILASVDAEVDATMSGIDTNALSNESDIISELSDTELSSTGIDADIDAILAGVDAEVDATMSGIDTNALSNESDIVSELSSDGLSSTGVDAEALPAGLPQPDAAEPRDAGQYKPSGDEVQDKIRQLFKAEGSEPARIDIGADFADGAVDGRDAPFDLPDHVLTPTLADIYLQQGQPRLALHIYERLAFRDPDGGRFAAKIQDIHDILLQLPEEEPPDEPPAKKRVTEKTQTTAEPKAAERKKKGAESKEDRRPLAGVRIKKKDSSTSKSKRKTS